MLRKFILLPLFTVGLSLYGAAQYRDSGLTELKNTEEIFFAKKKALNDDLPPEAIHTYLSGDEKNLITWYKSHELFHELYDSVIISKQSFLMHKMFSAINSTWSTLSISQQKKLEPTRTKLIEYFSIWSNHKKMLGLEAEREAKKRLENGEKNVSAQILQKNRKYNFSRFFRLIPDFFSHKSSPSSGLKYLSLPPKMIAASVALIAGYPLAAFTYGITRLTTTTPMFTFASGLGKALPMLGSFKEPVIINKELLHAKRTKEDKNVINLYLPSHRHDIGDVVLMAALNLPNAIFFANGMVVGKAITGERTVGKFVANSISTAPGFISVGQARGLGQPNPAEKLLHALKKELSKNVINYPQGFVADMNEILSITPVFTEKLVKPLIEEGYKVRIIPITYDVPSDFIAHADRPLDLRAIVHQAFEPEETARIIELEKNGYPGLLNTILRSHWIRYTEKYPELTLDEAIVRIKENTGIDLGKDIDTMPE